MSAKTCSLNLIISGVSQWKSSCWDLLVYLLIAPLWCIWGQLLFLDSWVFPYGYPGHREHGSCKLEAAIIATNQHYSEGPNQCNKIRKRNKGHKYEKERSKTFKNYNDVIVYLRNLRVSHKKLLGLVRELSKVPKHMLSIEKPKPCLCN